jgi:PHD/YefM family antitoxin component YafN of YafNO toxin-antitoxin module
MRKMTTTTIEETREELSQMIQKLPDDKVTATLDFVRALQDEDDEPLTEDELAQIAEAEADIAAGRVYTLEEFNRRMAALS